MTVKLDFEECLKDSPRFRASVESVESAVSELENRLEKLLKLSSSLLESGRHYLTSFRAFISGIQELSNLGPPEPMMTECLDKFTESLSHKINCHEDLLNATQQTLKQQIQSFVKESLRGFWEARREFWKGAEYLEAALNHNAEVPRRRAHEAEEAMAALKIARAGYQGRALDYVLQVTPLPPTSLILGISNAAVLPNILEQELENVRGMKDIEDMRTKGKSWESHTVFSS